MDEGEPGQRIAKGRERLLANRFDVGCLGCMSVMVLFLAACAASLESWDYGPEGSYTSYWVMGALGLLGFYASVTLWIRMPYRRQGVRDRRAGRREPKDP